MSASSQYVIGIDLGTTNCTMASAALQDGASGCFPIAQESIPQIVQAGTQGASPLLPSFIYFPLDSELATKAAAVDWAPERRHCVGQFACARGQELPQRLIASAKSWLCHSVVDRRTLRLPIGHVDAAAALTPVEACAELLRHLKEVWDNAHPGAPFERQQVLVTVPASFDPSARRLVQDAAVMADYPEIVLLEEPQAAFYAWLHQQGDGWRKQLVLGDTVLVVDIGGGTTDFSLIEVKGDGGDLALERIAVGAHLLLGGDNIDHALAHLARQKLEAQGHDLDDWQMHALVQACRGAKEQLLNDHPERRVELVVPGRGSRLVGGSLSVTLERDEVIALIVDGFFPLIKPEERARSARTSGMQQVGLPYAQDPRISAQLAKFLSLTGERDSASMDQFVVPTAVLFNGGTLKAARLRERLVELLNSWASALGRPPVRLLPEPQYDLAVSRGAVCYGLARLGRAVRIKGGISRSYFIGVEDAVPAIPGMSTPLRAVCVAPFGMEEGSECELTGQEFALLLGQPATFRFFSQLPAAGTAVPTVGSVVRQWRDQLTELHPVETILERQEGEGTMVRVALTSKVTELGVLELWCVAPDGRRWKLEFDIRHAADKAFADR